MNMLKLIGRMCKKYRTEVLKVPQSIVANETGYSVENVSKFECGKTNNLKIYLWYEKRGFKL